MKETIQGSHECSLSNSGSTCKIKHILKDCEDVVTIDVTIKMTINKDTKSGQRIIEKMLAKQESPAVVAIREVEKNSRIDFKEGKYIPLFYIADEEGKIDRPTGFDWETKKFK